MKTKMVLEAVLLFHDGKPWDDGKMFRWQVICRTVLVEPKLIAMAAGVEFNPTTRVLCDLVRAALGGSETIR